MVNSKQRKTLRAVFTEPVPATIEWAEIENLLLAVGCELVEGRGSRIRFANAGTVESFHRRIRKRNPSAIRCDWCGLFWRGQA